LITGLSIVVAGCLPALASPPQAEPAPSVETYALLVGCTEYPELAKQFPDTYEASIRLRGPANDVELMRHTLVHVLDVEEQRITVLIGWPDDEALRPTRKNILRHLGRLAKLEAAGARVVIYLAGHGSQQRDARQGPEEPDGMDEIFLPADVRGASRSTGRVPNAITDDEIGRHTRNIRDSGADVWLIIDACHSGTMLRGAPNVGDSPPSMRLRSIPASVLGSTPAPDREPRGGYREAQELGDASMAGIAAMYGAQSYGSAPEMDLPKGSDDAEAHGLFTYLLAQELTKSHGQITYEELGNRVVASYQAFPCRITIPVAEGDLAREISTGEASTGPRLLLSVRADGSQWLAAGRMAGIQPGAIVELTDLEGEVLGRAEVLEASLHESSCKSLTDTKLERGDSYRARLVHQPFGDTNVKWSVTDVDGRPLGLQALPQAVRDSLQEEGNPTVYVKDPEQADWLVIPEGSTLRLRPAPRVGGRDWRDVNPELIVRVFGQIVHARNIKLLAASSWTDDMEGNVEVWVERRTARGATPQRLQAGELVHPGDQIRVLLRKPNPGDIFDVGVFYVDANFEVMQLFPTGQQIARLEADATAELVLVDWVGITDDALGVEHIVVYAFPRLPESAVVPMAGIAQPSLQTRGGGDAEQCVDLMRRILRGEGLRGVGTVTTDLGLPRSSLVTLQTEWPELGPPAWPKRGVVEMELSPMQDQLDALPLPLPTASRAAFVHSKASRSSYDALLVGDEQPRTIWLDMGGGPRRVSDPAEALEDFSPDAVFHFGSESWVAYYDSDHDGRLDLGLVDRDLDTVADERWDLGQGGWTQSNAGRAPWLSQAHLVGLRLRGEKKREASMRFGLLVRSGE
jgi:hypothetical protein